MELLLLTYFINTFPASVENQLVNAVSGTVTVLCKKYELNLSFEEIQFSRRAHTVAVGKSERWRKVERPRRRCEY
jgi:hypothetical protein